jgi:hypothetical protein
LSSDTSPEVARVVAERFRDMSGRERFMIGVQMFETARALVMASLPPGVSEQERRHHLCARFYPEISNAFALSRQQAVVDDHQIDRDQDE